MIRAHNPCQDNRQLIVLAIVITRPAKMIVGPIRIRARAGHAVADFLGPAYFNSDHSLAPPCSPRRAEEGRAHSCLKG